MSMEEETSEVLPEPYPVRDEFPAPRPIAVRSELTVDELIAQAAKVTDAMKRAMVPDVHYGKIPGVQKPSLLKAGAEKLAVLFGLRADYDVLERWDPDSHYYVRAFCTLTRMANDVRIATGFGSCTTRESRYAFRGGQRLCPVCGQPFIYRSKFEPGWYCWNSPEKGKFGCGSKFDAEDPKITEQVIGRVPNEDLADQWNTVLKMAQKRALVAAILNGTAASDVFTQDVEDSSVEAEVAQAEADKTASTTATPPPRVVVPTTWAARIEEADRVMDLPGGSAWRLFRAAVKSATGFDPKDGTTALRQHSQEAHDDSWARLGRVIENLWKAGEKVTFLGVEEITGAWLAEWPELEPIIDEIIPRAERSENAPIDESEPVDKTEPDEESEPLAEFEADEDIPFGDDEKEEERA
jgi:hypothetical protein